MTPAAPRPVPGVDYTPHPETATLLRALKMTLASIKEHQDRYGQYMDTADGSMGLEGFIEDAILRAEMRNSAQGVKS